LVMGKKKAAEQEEVSEEEVSEEEVSEEVAETKKKKKKKSEEAGEEPEKKKKKKKQSEEKDEQEEDQQEVSQNKGKKRPADADAEDNASHSDPEAQKQLDQHIARLESLKGPEHARVRTRIFKKIGRLRAKLDGERPRSKPLIAKAAQKKRRKKLIFGDQVPVRPERDTRPQRLRKKEAAAAGPVTVVLVGGLPWEVLDQQLKDKIDKTGKVLNGGIVKCQVAMNRKGLSRGFGFVELQNEGDAKGLVAALNENEWEGRIMSAKVVPGRDNYVKPAAAAPDQNAESKPEQAQQPAEPSNFIKKAPAVNTVKASQSKVVKF